MLLLGACSAQKAAKIPTTQINSGVPGPQTINCAVARGECKREQLLADGSVGCAEYYDTAYFNASICTLDGESFNDACNRVFCKRDTANPHANYDYKDCVVRGDLANELPLALCQIQPPGSKRASLLYIRSAHRCVPDPSGQFCASFSSYPLSDDASCFDLTERTAIDQLAVPTDARDARLQVQLVVLDAPPCNQPAPLNQGALAYSITNDFLGSITAAGVSVPMTATQGTARVLTTCNDGVCTPTTLASLQMKMANATVLGVPLTNVTARSRGTPAVVMIPDVDGPRPGFAAGTLSLVFEGNVAGVPSRYVVGNDSNVSLDASTSSLNLRGIFRLQDVTGLGRPLVATASISIDATPLTGTAAACLAQDSLTKLFGFETLGDWTSTQATIGVVSSPVTQGCGALSAVGQGYFTIDGRTFANSKVAIQPAVSADLFVPSSQPNPYWTGAMQMFLTCPSRTIFNQYIGQVELTGKPQNKYITLRFPLSGTLQDALRRASDDCRFTLALNVNPTGRTWLIDNLRFTP